MIVSFSRRFVFVHVPKTAGESITKALLPFLSRDDVVLCRPVYEQLAGFEPRGSWDKHSGLARIRDACGPSVGDFFSFGFVRNPWDRVVSYFHYLHPGRPFAGGVSREEFERHVDRGPPRFPCWRSAAGLDFVGRFESLERDFARVCERLGVEARLEKTNASARGPYRQYFDDATRARVAERNADDLREYGYEF